MNFTTRVLLYFLLICSASSVFAQEDLDVLLQESIVDGRKLVKGYVDPFMKSMSLGLNQGWYNTAKPHKLLGIDITVTAAAMMVPDDELFYNVDNLNLESVELDPSSPDAPRAPTIIGPDRAPVYRLQDNPSTTYEGPEGLDLEGNIGKNWVPVPMVTLGIGLPKETDLKIRYTPNIEFDGSNGSVQLLGFGVMHNIKQYLPGLKLLPFDLSAFVGYTHFKINYKFDDDVQGENQRGEFAMNATTIQGVISRKFSVITLYGGVGYNVAKSNLSMLGWYDVNENDVEDENERNPIDEKFAASGPRITAGFRLKLAILTIHADYTLQKYSSLTAGIGLSVR